MTDKCDAHEHAEKVDWIALAVVLSYVLSQRGVWSKLTLRLPGPVLGFAYAALLTLSLLLSPELERAFIYFQF